MPGHPPPRPAGSQRRRPAPAWGRRHATTGGHECLGRLRRSTAPTTAGIACRPACSALLLQTHDKVSDAEAKARADFDIRWKVALGIEIEDRPFAKSTLQVFRARITDGAPGQDPNRPPIGYPPGQLRHRESPACSGRYRRGSWPGSTGRAWWERWNGTRG